MILSFKKFDNLLLYLSLKVGVNFMNSQHLRLKWHFEKLDKYGPRSLYFLPSRSLDYIQPQIRKSWDSMENANKKRK